MPELKVTVTNNCVCSQSQVMFKCDGFQTNEAVDPTILTISDDVCILQKVIPPFETIEFLYAWDPPFPFQPISSKEIC